MQHLHMCRVSNSVNMCTVSGIGRNQILLCISSASLCTKDFDAKLLLTRASQSLIRVFMHLRSSYRHFMIPCSKFGDALEICDEIIFHFYSGLPVC